MKKYFLHSNGQHIGPYTAEDLRMMSISPSTPIWCEGLAGWKNAGDIPGLNHLFAAPAPPPTPSYYQPPTYYQQPVTPYYATNQQPENNKKKSSRGRVMLIGGIALLIIGVCIYATHRVTKAWGVISDTQQDTLSYSYDTGFQAFEMSPQNPSSTPGLFQEEQPQFPGGQKALIDFICKNIKYPSAAKNMGIQGTVYVQFTVERNGEVTNRKVVRSISPELDREALRMLYKMPKWKPGKKNGFPVRTEMTQPVRFVLQ
jgi:TonB family protein